MARPSAGEAHFAVTDFLLSLGELLLGSTGVPLAWLEQDGGPCSTLSFLPDCSRLGSWCEGCRRSVPRKGSQDPRGRFQPQPGRSPAWGPSLSPALHQVGFGALPTVLCSHLLNNSATNFSADMNRTFPDNVKFRKSADPCLQKTLYNVLLAYGHHNRGVGYCQVSPREGEHHRHPTNLQWTHVQVYTKYSLLM